MVVATKKNTENLIIKKLPELVEKAIKKAYPDLTLEDSIDIEYPKDHSHGDYSCNIALKLAKKLNESPFKIAEKIKDSFIFENFIAKIEIAGPGFLNFWLSNEWLSGQIKLILERGDDFGQTKLKNQDVIVIDLSAPNIAKPMSVGHLRSTVIGDSLVRILQALGHRVIGDNHLGDWGTQFGKLIFAYKKWGNKEAVEKNPIPELLNLYVKFHDEAKTDPQIEEGGRAEFKKLENGDQENRDLWKLFKEESLKEFNKIYQKLNVEIEEALGESFYEDKMAPIIDVLLQKKIAEKNDDGSIAVVFEKHGINLPSCLLVKKDGGTLYHTRDLATLKYRIDHFKARKAIYAVGAEQKLYFQQLFAIVKLLNWKIDCVHVDFGLVRLPEGKLSTRAGRVVYLEDLISEAENKVAKILQEKAVNFPSAEQQKLIETLAIGSIKYNDLSQNRLTEIVFDWNKMLSFEGNSCPYLQYTFARSRSILRKSGMEEKIEKNSDYQFSDEKELKVLRLISKYEEYVISAARELKPNIIAGYLYELTQNFNVFYNSLPVINSENDQIRLSRLALVKSLTIILKKGLYLLGINVPERM